MIPTLPDELINKIIMFVPRDEQPLYLENCQIQSYNDANQLENKIFKLQHPSIIDDMFNLSFSDSYFCTRRMKKIEEKTNWDLNEEIDEMEDYDIKYIFQILKEKKEEDRESGYFEARWKIGEFVTSN